MGTRVGRSTLFGIPLQQQWSYANPATSRPTYYLQSDAPLYYYSFTDAYIAACIARCRRSDQARFDPMITGFNPSRHVRRRPHPARARDSSPACSRDRRVHASTRNSSRPRSPGETASLTNPALDRILDFAADAGLVGIIHNDIDVPFAKPDAEPAYLAQMTALLGASSEDVHHLGALWARSRRAPSRGIG